MRIAVNASSLDERAGGLGRYARSIIGYLSQHGDEVVVYAPDCVGPNGHAPTNRRSTPTAIRAAAGSVGSIIRALAWCQTALPLRVLRDRVDVILSTVPEGMLVPVCPQVVVVHDLMPLFFPEEYPRWKHYFRHVLPRLLKSCCRIIADSEHTKGDLIREFQLPGEKIEVVYPWVDPLFLSEDPGTPPREYDEKPFFIFIGVSIPRKNLETVIRALAKIQNRVNHDLVCVLGIRDESDQEHCSRMLELATELGVRQRLHLYSRLSQQEILFLYRRATALVMLSKYEGFGYPPLEAMAVGTPAIVSDSTSLGEVSGPAGISVPCMDADAAARAMLRLAMDADYRRGLVEAGLLHAARFSREETGRRILTILGRSAAHA